ncbi:MAG: hypothetical protein FWG44_00075 [Oscillospiraceae bacterium]|nr:hypothetical protein [Oscillospiraceae bacterium]
MLNLIDSIINIDKNARLQLEQAKLLAREILESAEAECKKIEFEYTERADKRLSVVDETYSKIAQEDIEVIENREKEQIAKIEAVMAENRNAWKREISERILKA